MELTSFSAHFLIFETNYVYSRLYTKLRATLKKMYNSDRFMFYDTESRGVPTMY